ncbi:hypothetical protein GGE67_004744 [Rhizobium leucaenae]|uniref:Uncharacterized protein n=1 Tax=Rhizobium leucaenae TaxID=29450 RepID=A0A7W6ZZS0_9HYPH|nr:hypothetical protein [Rhizobium leucaenae]MBB6304101.1 hypothetical protein [Rhizobium leucaenae]
MSEHSHSLESTRHCLSDRKPKGTIIYIVVAAVVVLTGLTSGRHESSATPQQHIEKMLQ